MYKGGKSLEDEIRGTDAIVNLAGSAILKWWTNKNKQIIYDSRVRTTKNVIQAIRSLPKEKRPNKFISASAVGIYKSGLIHDESSTNFNSGFVGKVVQDWEDASNDLPDDMQRIIFRIGIVLGKEAKSVKNLILPTKMGLAATLGKGKQGFPFVHEKDATNAIIWALEDYNQSEVFNLVAPENISNKDFIKAFAKQLNRPAFLLVPSFFIKLILGEASELLLQGVHVQPRNLIQNGFQFKYPDIKSSLSEILA